MFHYVLFWICVVGLCLGSFYNVVILRSLSNESIVFPASKCPRCEHKLYWWHNIPVFSYILLGGKCYFCKQKISVQYPVVELATMLLFGFTFWKFGFSIKTIFALLWISGFIIMTVTDLKEKLVDCNIAIALAVSGILFNFITSGVDGVIQSVLGLVVGAVVLEVVARLGYLFVGSRAMGEADSYVAAALGAIFGFENIGFVLLYSLFTSMVFIVPMFLYNQYKNNNKLTCVFSVLFILSILVFKTFVQNWFTLFAVVLTGSVLAISILMGMKDTESRNYLPYVPALALGGLYFLFF